MNNPVEEIKDRLDVLEVIKGYVRLQKAGANWKALCPFHNEKTPSFTVSPEKQMWYCFGCGEGGDVFNFVQKIENLEFADSLRILAEKAGVQLKKTDPQLQSKRKEYYEVVELATKFFQRQLESKTGQAVLKYLQDRGLKKETVLEWQLGYAPDKWQGLYDFLLAQGYSAKTVEGAGLAINSNNKARPWHDRFRHRIIFPIFDVQGQAIGFTGRVFDKVTAKTLGEEAGKYINTSNTLIYDKSRVLYGLDKARAAIKEAKRCIFVEGNMDVLMAHQAGTKNVVAVSGTALGEQHVNIVKRYTDNIALAFDSDEAGHQAARKASFLLLAKGLSPSVIVLPGAKDAAELIKKDVALWQKASNESIAFVQFVLDRALEKASSETLAGKKAIAQNVLEAIRNINSPLEREHWVGELALKIGVNEETLLEEMGPFQTRQSAVGIRGERENKKISEESNKLEEYLLALLVSYPEGIKHLGDYVSFVTDEDIKKIFEQCLKGVKAEEIIKKNSRFSKVLIQAEFLDEIEDEEAEFLNVLGYLKKRNIKERLKTIEIDLKRVERSKDIKAAGVLLTQFNNLSKELITHEKEKDN